MPSAAHPATTMIDKTTNLPSSRFLQHTHWCPIGTLSQDFDKTSGTALLMSPSPPAGPAWAAARGGPFLCFLPTSSPGSIHTHLHLQRAQLHTASQGLHRASWPTGHLESLLAQSGLRDPSWGILVREWGLEAESKHPSSP